MVAYLAEEGKLIETAYFVRSKAKTPAKARSARIYAQAGGAPAANLRGAGFPRLGLDAEAAGLVAVWPQTGQPAEKRRGAPTKPQAWQSTSAKDNPHWGQVFASRVTSAPQFSQKNRSPMAGR
jgi:hypothetical protein